jgi:hypothetical protein
MTTLLIKYNSPAMRFTMKASGVLLQGGRVSILTTPDMVTLASLEAINEVLTQETWGRKYSMSQEGHDIRLHAEEYVVEITKISIG